jgi:hypothetical protein
LGFILFHIFQGVGEWNKNNHSPIATTTAKVVTKRSQRDSHPHTTDTMTHHYTSTTYYTTFQLPNGERMEFRVSGKEFGMLAEGDEGILTYQGSRYKHFERKY